jgi:hypothetical protein
MPRRINFSTPTACPVGTPLPFALDSLYNDTHAGHTVVAVEGEDQSDHFATQAIAMMQTER